MHTTNYVLSTPENLGNLTHNGEPSPTNEKHNKNTVYETHFTDHIIKRQFRTSLMPKYLTE